MVSAATSARREHGPYDSGSLTEPEPMPQNPVHAALIALLVWNLRRTLLRRHAGALVLTDVFWIDPADPRPLAPDVGVAIGAPAPTGRAFRTTEAGTGLQVVVEIVSRSELNPLDRRHVAGLAERYGRRGVDEYVEFHMTTGALRIFDRRSGAWAEVEDPWGWTSAHTGLHPLRLVPAPGLGFTLEVEGPEGRYEDVAEVTDRLDRMADRLRALGIDPDDV